MGGLQRVEASHSLQGIVTDEIQVEGSLGLNALFLIFLEFRLF